MTALAADRITRVKEWDLAAYPVKAATLIYDGALVAIDASGYAVPASDTAALVVVGKAVHRADNSAGSNADINVLVEAGKKYLFDATSITLAMTGQRMYVVDDHTFDDAKGTNAVLAGILAEYVSTTSGYLYIPKGQQSGNISGVGAGYKIARGQLTTASASDTVITGLASVVSALACYDTDPADANTFVSCSIGDQAGAPAAGSILVKTWKSGDGADVTPVAASAFSKKVNWVAIGL